MAGMFVLLVALVGACAAAAPKRCCTPKQWTGSFSEAIGSATASRRGHDRRGFAMIVNNITVDYKDSRVAMQEFIIKGRAVLNYHVIADFKKKKGYMVDIRKKKCIAVDLKKPMESNCIPKSAKYYGSVNLGSLAKGLHINSWGIQIKNRHMRAHVSLSVDDSCIPVGELVIGGSRRTGFMANIGYFNIQGGIKDPSVFDVPAICKKESVGVLIDDVNLNVKTYMFHRFSQ